MNPICFDLYSGAGGSAQGYANCGYEIVGVDNVPQYHYKWKFYQQDARAVLQNILLDGHYDGVRPTLIHASPPCQAYSFTRHLTGNTAGHPKLLDETRMMLRLIHTRWGYEWVMENVGDAPMESPYMLCGAMFPDLNVYRHRFFETSREILIPPHPAHEERQAKMGEAAVEGERWSVIGNQADPAGARKAMGIDWMNRAELSQAIPPPYTEWIGSQLMMHCV